MEVGDHLMSASKYSFSGECHVFPSDIGTETSKTFKEFRRSGQLCDVTITAEGHSFPCHRLVLSACSPYFRALFTNDGPDTERREIIIPSVSADIMKLIIDFAYELKSDIRGDNIEQLLPAADQFHVNGLVKACCDFLKDKMSVENCIGIYKFSRAFCCSNLEKIARQFLMEHFNEIHIHSNEFIQLSVDEICDFLSADELNVKSEETVFEAVIRWIDFDADMRKSCMSRLLNTMRLGLVSSHFFMEKIKSHPYVKDNEACKATVKETIRNLFELDLEDYISDADIFNPTIRPRVPHELLFVIGGWSGGTPTNVIETFDTRASRWVVSDSIDTGPRAYHGTLCLNHKVYVVGGFDGAHYFSSVRCFDPITREWTEIAPMYSKRCYVSTAVLDGQIYAMGGHDGHHRLRTAERYDPQQNQWTLIGSMTVKRSDASSTCLKGKVYVCGGFDGYQCLNSGEVFDPVVNQWTLIATMRASRSGISIVTFKDAIYAMGGFNGEERLTTVEKYCSATNTWQSSASMYTPRSNFTAQVLDSMIYALGGFDGVSTIFNAECYDGETDEWLVAPDMNLNRSALSCCVVTGLPNLKSFIHGIRDSGVRKERITMQDFIDF